MASAVTALSRHVLAIIRGWRRKGAFEPLPIQIFLSSAVLRTRPCSARLDRSIDSGTVVRAGGGSPGRICASRGGRHVDPCGSATPRDRHDVPIGLSIVATGTAGRNRKGQPPTSPRDDVITAFGAQVGVAVHRWDSTMDRDRQLNRIAGSDLVFSMDDFFGRSDRGAIFSTSCLLFNLLRNLRVEPGRAAHTMRTAGLGQISPGNARDHRLLHDGAAVAAPASGHRRRRRQRIRRA